MPSPTARGAGPSRISAVARHLGVSGAFVTMIVQRLGAPARQKTPTGSIAPASSSP